MGSDLIAACCRVQTLMMPGVVCNGNVAQVHDQRGALLLRLLVYVDWGVPAALGRLCTKVVAYMFCSQEGLCSTFLQAPILPTMQDAAHAADRAHKLQRFGYSSKGSGEAEEEEEEQDEMTTNITTSVFTTIRMGGAILGYVLQDLR
jgi:hypothetical protein